jgi:plastocyanin
MRRGLSIAFAAAVLLAVPAAAPATAYKVQITKDGFSPAKITLTAGDSISWVNNDGHVHRVVCNTCKFASNTLKQHDTYAFSFLHEGRFTVTDPLNKGKTLTVVVKRAPATVSMAATPTSLAYGKSATITGVVSSHRAGQDVEILAQKCIASVVGVVANVKSKKGGTFSYRTRPSLVTTFHARYAAPTGTIVSSIVRVQVAPIVKLARVGRGTFSVSVTAGRPFVGKAVAFQRFLSKRGRWVTAKVVVLDRQHRSSAPIANSSVSTARFTAKVAKGAKVRALLRSFQALPCYATAWSAATTA